MMLKCLRIRSLHVQWYAVGCLLAVLASARWGAAEGQEISQKDGGMLLRIARTTLTEFLHRQTVPDLSHIPLSDRLREKRGVFVTLKERKTHELRGCIGYTAAVKELVQAVVDCTVYAATRDMRFTPLRAGEEHTVVIEISVLSPPRLVATPDEVQVGVHGVMVMQGAKSAVLLPQVALEQHWSRDELLQAVCRKAGLPDRAWEQGAQLAVFTAQVFSETTDSSSEQRTSAAPADR
ncbi:MAG: AmmeMemoRadiSam system protein A [Desulfobacterota bacterium]|nr:AmmeMemoRadiSam system protein A [Thermodesulfobacteriota bacterium]